MEHKDLTWNVIGAAMKVHRALGCGFLESVYQNALAYELRSQNIVVNCERKIEVFYREVQVGFFIADMLVENCVIIENKAVQALTSAHEAQLINYLSATRIEIGLVFNFGADSLEHKRKNRTYRLPQNK